MFKLSSEASLDGAITVENKFIVEYMPYADGDYVKVYLYGLSLAARKSSPDDSIERLARRLDMDIPTVEAAIDYWSELGLMSRLGDEICYFSPRDTRPKIKIYDVDKYAEFNRQAQLHISDRMIRPEEYREYYVLMERLNLEWQAMVLIIKYCVNIKGSNVSYTYILAVARNLASDGYRTSDEVGERLDEYGVYFNDLMRVLSVMGVKHSDHDSVQLYKKWVTEYKFTHEFINHVAQTVKRGGATMLDVKLTGYHDLGFASVREVEEYETERENLYKLTKAINKALGLYYENVDPEITTYVKPWLNLGFDWGAILHAAEYCMKKDLRRLSDLDAVVRDLFAQGLTSEAQVKAAFGRENRFDKNIEALLKSLNIKGAVKDVYRAYYANWADKWQMPDELITYSATLAADKANPFAYMNAILMAWHNSGVTSVEQAQSSVAVKPSDAPAPTGVVYERYTEEELNSMFTQITEDD